MPFLTEKTFTLKSRCVTQRYSPSNDHLTVFHGSKGRLDVKRDSSALYPESDQIKMKPSVELDRSGTFDDATKAQCPDVRSQILVLSGLTSFTQL